MLSQHLDCRRWSFHNYLVQFDRVPVLVPLYQPEEMPEGKLLPCLAACSGVDQPEALPCVAATLQPPAMLKAKTARQKAALRRTVHGQGTVALKSRGGLPPSWEEKKVGYERGACRKAEGEEQTLQKEEIILLGEEIPQGCL